MSFLDTGFLSNLPKISKCRTRSISAENPDGAKGGGAKEAPGAEHWAAMLGQGWKARPCIELPAGSTTTIARRSGTSG